MKLTENLSRIKYPLKNGMKIRQIEWIMEMRTRRGTSDPTLDMTSEVVRGQKFFYQVCV